MDKYVLGGTQLLALILTAIFVVYIMDIPRDTDHRGAITVSAIIIFSLTNIASIAIKKLLTKRRTAP